MRLTLIPIITLCFLLTKAHSQQNLTIGQKHNLYSENLKQEIQLQIYLPDDYNETNTDYPTLYILDGQWYFLTGVAIQETLRNSDHMPKSIVIGINMVDWPTRLALFDQWDPFKTFIETELINYVDQTFRTTDKRIIFGWENSGFLVSELLLKKDGVFHGAIASNGASATRETMKTYESESERFLFVANSNKDIFTVESSEQAAAQLDSANLRNLRWEYRLFDEEIHESLPNLSLYQGLRFYYHNYPKLIFSTIDEFYKAGGIPYLTKYYKERGERFGLSTGIDNSTKNPLIWLAWKRDNFEAFELFMEEFADVLSTSRYASSYWQNRLAQFYLKHQANDKAIEYFERAIKEYPDDRFMAQMYYGLGIAYSRKGQTRIARVNFKKAIEVAERTNDPRLVEYRQALEKIK